jgi:repressor LexA
MLSKTNQFIGYRICFSFGIISNGLGMMVSENIQTISGGNIMSYGKISAKQREILEYLKSQIINRGYPPAVREICEAVKLKSTSSVHSHLETLEKNGYIRRDPSKPRAIEIMDDGFNLTRRELVNVPIVGTITAGQPILAVENVEGYFPVPTEYMPNEETFMLKVKGESMINSGIFDGDKILVQRQNTASNGDIVVALLDDSVTVKTFYKEDSYYRLQPENDTMDPIIVSELEILGKVIGLFRLFQ